MTLILTHISRFGIVHATDSNLTSGSGSQAGQSQKLFPLPHLQSALTIAGAYSVGNIMMDQWMSRFIQRHIDSGSSSLDNFAQCLRSELEDQMLLSEKEQGSIIHIAGYVEHKGVFHPEFYHVRNVHGVDPHTGEYCDINETFEIGEDFWTRDCPKSKLMQAFQNGVYQLYINGFASGRIGYVALQSAMNEFFQNFWNNPSWKFRPPSSLDETKILVELYIQIVSAMFLISDYSAPLIGGGAQIYAIPQPDNIATTC
ncbi:MAG: hypothetical protein IPM66_14810 [Acidobacteriota bacterium]|nr:MAG: hypothetical protein IPM66_14810 [Acidobacteriota bacterium]